MVVVVVGLVVADHVDLNEYVLTPGHAQAVGPLLRLPNGKGHRSHGKVLLTDVYVTRVTALNYLPFRLDGNAHMVTASTLLGPTPPDQMLPQGYLEMAQSQAAAKAAALKRLGYQVPEHAAGALVFAVEPGSPASKDLHVGQVVTAVGGTPTPDVCAFVHALAPLEPGTAVDLTVRRDRVTSSARQVEGPIAHERIRMGSWPATVPAPKAPTGCPGTTQAPHSYLGVQVETQQDFTFPFPIRIQTSRIGGPSAGLAMTMGIIDSLSGGHLTGGRTVAATGTIDPAGHVGDVGGVPQKTVAVERAGATVFFVPADERATAVAKATPSLHVYGVRSLSQVLTVLQRLGGSVPANHQAGRAA